MMKIIAALVILHVSLSMGQLRNWEGGRGLSQLKFSHSQETKSMEAETPVAVKNCCDHSDCPCDQLFLSAAVKQEETSVVVPAPVKQEESPVIVPAPVKGEENPVVVPAPVKHDESPVVVLPPVQPEQPAKSSEEAEFWNPFNEWWSWTPQDKRLDQATNSLLEMRIANPKMAPIAPKQENYVDYGAFLDAHSVFLHGEEKQLPKLVDVEGDEHRLMGQQLPEHAMDALVHDKILPERDDFEDYGEFLGSVHEILTERQERLDKQEKPDKQEDADNKVNSFWSWLW